MLDVEKWKIIRGLILASNLTHDEKRELLDFINMWEERSDLWDD